MITKYTQSNGLRVILEPIETAVSVSVGLWVARGSRNEFAEEYGYAHFVEHMLFKGTQKYSAQEMAKMVDRVGGQHNAATNREYTCYYISLIADHLEMAVDILSDMFYNPLFSSDELEKEKHVVIEEIKMYEDTPDDYVHDMFAEYMLKGHPLGHSILGTADNIEKSTRESLKNFYERNYINENAVLVIVGNFSVDNAKALASSYFNQTKKSQEELSPTPPSEPERVSFKHVHKDIEQSHLCTGVWGLTKTDEGRWPLYILSTILGGSMSSRLFQKIREDAGLCYSVYSFHSGFKDQGLFGIYCATGNENFSKVVDLIMDECRLLVREGVTAEELQDAKTFIKGNLALSLENIEVRMGQLAKNEINFGRHFTFDEIVNKIDAVSMNNFVEVMERLLKNKEMSLISVGRQPKDFKNTSNMLI